MPKTIKPPSYRRHRSSGQAVVTLNGRDHYLGLYGSKTSEAEYDRLVGEWLASGRRLPVVDGDAFKFTVAELLAAYLRHAKRYYRKNGKPTKEVWDIKNMMRAVKRSYARIPAEDFTPLKLKAVRQQLIDQGYKRTNINANVGRIKRMFAWGVENELVPASTYQALRAVAGLRRGRTDAPEGEPVRPVPDEHVDAIKPHVSRQVWALVELQRLTGTRSGEVVIMRGCDLDASGPIWLYRPDSHKTEHHGHDRIVEIGPRAQRLLRPFLKSGVEAFLFSPVDAEAERRADLRAKRKTPLKYGNRPGTNRKRRPKREPQDRYSPDSYRRAITRGCDLADRAAKQAKGLPANSEERIIPRWHPHQLRHNFGTRVRREYGIETARILLGHHSVPMAELYSEVDRGRAREVMGKIG